jgi:hypothetical protein
MTGKVKDGYEIKSDNLTNLQEFLNGTDPTLYDTDDDSFYDNLNDKLFWLSDDYELNDRGCWSDISSIHTTTDPTNADTDGDKMSDGWEEYYGLNPCNASDRFLDLDDDGLANYLEIAYPSEHNVWFRTIPINPDTDHDSLPDGWEAFRAKIVGKIENAHYELDIKDGLADGIAYTFTSNPMIVDIDLDLDGLWYNEPGDSSNEIIYHKASDGLTNLLEYYYSTNPSSPDSDGDGLVDGDETGYFYNTETGEPMSQQIVTIPVYRKVVDFTASSSMVIG